MNREQALKAVYPAAGTHGEAHRWVTALEALGLLKLDDEHDETERDRNAEFLLSATRIASETLPYGRIGLEAYVRKDILIATLRAAGYEVTRSRTE